MNDPRIFRLRVIYGKTGRLVQLSHLELARTLERTIRRSKLPFAITQGFSPHMRISFGSALPVGVGGTQEMFDLFLRSYIREDLALSALQAASVVDLMPHSCAYVEPASPACSIAFPLSTYRARLSFPQTLEMPASVDIVRKKKTKRLSVEDYLRGGFSYDATSGDTCVTFTLEAKKTASLRPDVFLQACIAETAKSSSSFADLRVLSIFRIAQNPL